MPDQTLQDIKDRLDIAEVIGSYIQLKKSGANYKALCPFHNEKSPSMQISTQKQIWHCFGCGEGGDIFGFVIKYENIEFKEALKILADKAGVKLPEYRPKDKNETNKEEQLYKINDFAARFYHEILFKDKGAAAARDYLKNRGLSQTTIDQWKIGYAPNNFHDLEQALIKKKVSLADMVAAGVSAKNDRGQIYDRFRGRITFPIFNALGAVVGFSARILPQNDNPSRPLAKYINSPETPIYSKSKILFGFNFAKAGIRKQDEVIIVEGQMDCISPHQAGFTNVVASSGTALTAEQLTQVGRLTKNLKFCFDTDQAGLIATKRAVANYLGKDFTIKIISLKGAKDPDELIKKDPKEFTRQVAAAPLFLDFYLEKSFENFRNTVTEKKAIAKELLPLIKLLTDPIEQEHYINQLAAKLGTTTQALNKALETGSGAISTYTQAPYQTGTISQSPPPPTIGALEKQILGGIMLNPNFANYITKQSDASDFSSPETQDIFKKVSQGQPEQVNKTPLAEECLFMVESQLAESGGNEKLFINELQKSFALFKLPRLKQKQKNLGSQIKQAEVSKNKTELLRLNQEFMQLNKIRVELEKLL